MPRRGGRQIRPHPRHDPRVCRYTTRRRSRAVDARSADIAVLAAAGAGGIVYTPRGSGGGVCDGLARPLLSVGLEPAVIDAGSAAARAASRGRGLSVVVRRYCGGCTVVVAALVTMGTEPWPIISASELFVVTVGMLSVTGVRDKSVAPTGGD